MTHSGKRGVPRQSPVESESHPPGGVAAPVARSKAWAGRYDPNAPKMAFYDGVGNPLVDGTPPIRTLRKRYTARVFITRDGVVSTTGTVAVSLIVCAETARAWFHPGCMRAVRLLLRHGHRVAVVAPVLTEAEALAKAILSMARAAP